MSTTEQNVDVQLEPPNSSSLALVWVLPVGDAPMVTTFSESAPGNPRQLCHKQTKSPFETSPKGLIWRTQEGREARAKARPQGGTVRSNPTAKDEGNPAFSKSSAPGLWPSAAQRARKRAKFSIPEHVEFVGNWEVADVERRVVELN